MATHWQRDDYLVTDERERLDPAAVHAFLCDVFVDGSHRGSGLGKWLVQCVLSHPDLQGLRRLSLMTRDAHGLYSAFGFKPLADASRYLEIHRPDIYGK